MKRKSCTVIPAHQVQSVPTTRHLPLVDLLVDTRTELLELAVRSGMKVLEAMMEEDRTTLCGARYAHEPNRAASRAGSVASEVVLGGRKVALRRPRVRAEGHEVSLPTFQVMAQTDPLNRRVVEQMLVGVTTRQYGRSLEPIGEDMTPRHEQERRQPALRRADDRATGEMAVAVLGRSRSGRAADRCLAEQFDSRRASKNLRPTATRLSTCTDAIARRRPAVYNSLSRKQLIVLRQSGGRR